MNKSSTIVKIFLYYIVITIIATSLGATVSGGPTLAFAIPGETPNLLNVLEYLWGMVQIFFGFFTFAVDGLPAIVSLLFFWLPAIYILLWVISLIRGVS